MAIDAILAKVESARQAAELGALAGSKVVVSDVSSVTKLATLTPEGGSAVTVKLDATRQIAELKTMIGKTVIVGKSPTALGGIGSWVSLYPVAQGNGAVVAAGAGAGAATNPLVMMKVVGGEAAAQLPTMAGKSFTVLAPPAGAGKVAPMLYLKPTVVAAGAEVLKIPVSEGVLAQTSGLVGKTFTVAKSPVVGANFGQYLVLKPAVASAGAKAATGGLAAKIGSLSGGKSVTAASASVASAGIVAPAVGALNPIASATAGQTILAGKGIGLGLGLGFGAWGPVVLGVLGVAGVVALTNSVIKFRRRESKSQQALLDELAASAKA